MISKEECQEVMHAPLDAESSPCGCWRGLPTWLKGQGAKGLASEHLSTRLSSLLSTPDSPAHSSTILGRQHRFQGDLYIIIFREKVFHVCNPKVSWYVSGTRKNESLRESLNERMAEVERVMQTRSASPATTVEQSPTFHEDIVRLDSRIEAGFQAFSREVDELREKMSHGNWWTR